MERPNYWRAAVCGFVATYVMTVAAQWAGGIGLPRLDPSRLMAFSFGKSPYVFGLFAHAMNGVVLGLMYAKWEKLIPGKNAWIKGIWIGIITTLAAKIIVGPLVGPPRPFWGSGPMLALVTSTIAHLAFGLALAVGYARDGER
ncbi:MAG: hypothetical protein O2807_01755 [bacterium]|nr:hypothetical protein [bacterium]